jgi:hypothetical protein
MADKVVVVDGQEVVFPASMSDSEIALSIGQMRAAAGKANIQKAMSKPAEFGKGVLKGIAKTAYDIGSIPENLGISNIIPPTPEQQQNIAENRQFFTTGAGVPKNETQQLGSAAGKFVAQAAPAIAVGAGVPGIAEKGISGIAGMAARGGAAGAVSSIPQAAEQLEAGDKGAAAKTMAIGTGAGAALGVLSPALTALADKIAGRVSSEISGTSEAALREYGYPWSRKAGQIRKAAGTEKQVGEDLVDALNNTYQNLPESREINDAISVMGQSQVWGGNLVPADEIAAHLRAQMKANAIGTEKAANVNINKMAQDIEKLPQKAGATYPGYAGGGTGLKASDLLDIRRRIDKQIGDSWGVPDQGPYIDALKSTRRFIADRLKQVADQTGQPQYISAMAALQKRLQAVDAMERYLGKTGDTREARVESFINNLFGRNSQAKQEAVAALDEVLGSNFLERSHLAQLAQELGPPGKPGGPAILPRQTTGRSLVGLTAAGLAGHTMGGPLGTFAAAPFASPILASPMLRTTGGIAGAARSNLGVSAAGTSGGYLPSYLQDYFKKKKKEGQ